MNEGNATERHPEETLVLQRSAECLIPFAIYTSGLIKLVEEYISEPAGQFSVDDLAWGVTESDVNQVVTLPDRCSAWSIDWVVDEGYISMLQNLKRH